MTEEEHKKASDEIDARCNGIARAEAELEGVRILLFFLVVPAVAMLALVVWRWFAWMGWCDEI